MKAHLYTVFAKNKWNWRLSINLRADMQYWHKQQTKTRSMYIIEPSFSLGLISLLKESLSEMSWDENSTLDRMLEQIHQEGHHLHIEKSWLEKIVWKEISLEVPQDKNRSLDPNPMVDYLKGRFILLEELIHLLEENGLQSFIPDWTSYVQMGYLQGKIQIYGGMKKEKQKLFPWQRKTGSDYRCRRCGSGEVDLHWTRCSSCNTECCYCEECLLLGRNKLCSILIHGISDFETPNAMKTVQPVIPLPQWNLSEPQMKAVEAGTDFLQSSNEESFLLWAVTGAGKTEMMFPLIALEIQKKRKILIATPRKDVVLELYHRIWKAFPQQTILALFGGSEQKWQQADITIATTHQLIRFKEAFDFIIIDEVDAFPFHNNSMLLFAAKQASKQQGKSIFLTATPPKNLQNAVKKGTIQYVKVPVRYHRRPLPVPQIIQSTSVEIMVQLKKRSSALNTMLESSLKRGAQIFIFVPKIKLIKDLVSYLRSNYSSCMIEGVSSQDSDREEKVRRFRDGKIQLLVTTTILERGVTVPISDVIVMNADASYFDEVGLIQMAGRAGRSKDDPKGNVYFVSKEKTKSQVQAIKQIKQMNRLARKEGYLL